MIATIIQILASQAITALMLTAGLMTDRAVISDVRRFWKVLVAALLMVWVVIPLVVLGIVSWFDVAPRETALLMLMAISPGLPLVLQSVTKGHGSRQLALVILLATALLAPLLIPVWVGIVRAANDLPIDVSAGDVLRVVGMSALVPFAVGRIINHFAPHTAHRIAKVTNALFVAGVLILLVVACVKSFHVFGDISLRAYLAIVLATFAALGLGFVAGGPHRENRVTVAYAAAFGNPALALAIAAASFPDRDALPLVGAYALVRLVALVPFNLWVRRGRVLPPNDLVPAAH